MRSPATRYSIFWLGFLIVTLALAHAWAAPPGEITSVTADDDGKRIVISCKGSIGKHHARVLGGPNRLVIDFEDMHVGSAQKRTSVGKGPFTEIRVGQFKGRARLVVDFQQHSVPAYEVKREKDKVYLAFSPGTMEGRPSTKGASSDSPLSPSVLPAAAPPSGADEKSIAVVSEKRKATAGKRPTAPINLAPQAPQSSQGALEQRPANEERPAPVASATAAKQAPGSQEIKLSQRMDLNRPAPSTPLRRDPTESDARATTAPATGIPSTAGPGAGGRMVREVRPPVTPPTPDPRLVVQEITELKFIQVGHNSRLYIRGGDHLDYRLNKVSPTKVRVDLVNAEIPKAHQKPLRTDLFSTSVEMIVPGSQTIFVQLKDAVPYQVQKKKGVLMVDFPPPRFALTDDQKVALRTGGERERAGRESYEKEREALLARRGAARIMREEEFRRKAETYDKEIGRLAKEEEELRRQLKEVQKQYRITPDPEVFRKPITMDFQGISYRNAFRLLAEQAGINIIVGTGVTGTTTMRLFQVPLGQVIDHILQSHIPPLARDLVGNVMWVDVAKNIEDARDKRRREIDTQRREIEKNLGEKKNERDRLEKDRDKTQVELSKTEAEADRVAEDRPEVETVGATETIVVEGEPVTFVMEQIKLNYTKASDVVRVLECVFNYRCLGRTRAAEEARGRGAAAGMPATEAAAEGGTQQQQSFEQMQQKLQDQGFLPGNPVYDQYMEQWKRDNLATQSLAMRAERTLAVMGPETGGGFMDSKMKKVLAHAILAAEDKYNLIIVKDLPERLVAMKRVIATLDVPTPQVLIETRLVQATREWTRGLGILWGGRNSQSGVITGGPGTTNSRQTMWGVAGTTGAADTPTGGLQPVGLPPVTNIAGTPLSSQFMVNLPISLTNALVQGLGMQFGLISGQYATDLSLRLQLGEATGNSKIIARPKVQVIDGEKANIKQGRQIPYSTTSPQFGTQTQLVNVDLLLEVKPKIYPDGRVQMDVKVTDNDLGDIVNGQASINTREAKSIMIVKEGETAVIGGIIRKTDNWNRQGWPGIMNVPVLNLIFSSKAARKQVVELLIFLTPTIVKRPPTAS